MDRDGVALVVDGALQDLLAEQVGRRDGRAVGEPDAAVAPDGRREVPLGKLDALLAQEDDVKL